MNDKNKGEGGLFSNFPNVIKGDLIAHISRYSFTEVRNLFMDVLQKSQSGPPTKLHEEGDALS